MSYVVVLVKQKKGSGNKFVKEWHRGGTHVFDSLNKAREDAIRMYLRGWYSGMSANVSECFGKGIVPGVPISRSMKGTYGVSIGAVVRYKGEFYWALNDGSKKKYRLNMNGTTKSDNKPKSKTNEFGLNLNLR